MPTSERRGDGAALLAATAGMSTAKPGGRVASMPLLDLARAVARTTLDEVALARLRGALAEPVDWAPLPHLLVRHGLSLLAARHLAPWRSHLPEETWNAIEEQARTARMLALAGASELRRIAQAFDAAAIPLLAMKGPVLAQRIYGDLGARPFTDLDLLVAPATVPIALRLLQAQGYVAEFELTPRQETWFRRVDGDYRLVNRASAQIVELHARPLSRRFDGMPPFSTLWERRTAVVFAGDSIPVLGLDDDFLLQALHGGKHRWERLEWAVAIGELLRRGSVDPAAAMAATPSARRTILLACRVAERWVDAPLAPALRAACARDARVVALEERAWRRVETGAVDEGAFETAGKLWYNARLQQGMLRRLRFIYRWACWPSPEDWAVVSLPDALFFAYRVVRPTRLLARYGRHLLAAAGGDV